MSLLGSISGPRDLDRLSKRAARGARGARSASSSSRTCRRPAVTSGRTSASSSCTIALHRVFESPGDPIVWDTGHQSYVHKLLTGRQDFHDLRSRGGLAGYPQRSESAHDVVESSHASSSLSWADGISRAFARTGRADRHVVAVVGDGALTGGMTWEALNNITDDNDRNLVIVVNDNGRSYAPTIGGMARYLNRVRTGSDLPRPRREVGPGWHGALRHGRARAATAACAAARAASSRGSPTTSRCTRSSTSSTSGPIDGHDLAAITETLRAGEELQRSRARARHHREGARLRARPQRRGRSVPLRREDRSGDRSPGRRADPLSRGPTCSRDEPRARSARGATTSSRSPRRCCGRRGSRRSPSASPTASTTSASPSSTR